MTAPMDTDRLYGFLWQFASQRVLTTAARVGLLSALAQETASVDRLAERLGLDGLACGKVVRALCAMGVAEPSGDGYRLVAPLADRFGGDERDLTDFVVHAHQLYERWGADLEDWLRTGVAGRRKGVPSPEQIEKFGRAMRASAGMLAPKAAATLDLSGVKKMLDVGGGFGHYALAFAGQAADDFRAVVLDRPEVVAAGQRVMADHPHFAKLTYAGGDYHDADPGSGFDLALLANVLHQEGEQSAAALVAKAAGALSPGGRLAVIEFTIDDDQREDLQGALFAINMRSFGDTYPAPILRAWMEAAGIEDVQVAPLPPAHWMLHGTRANSGAGDGRPESR